LAKITKKQELLERALELYNQDYKLVSISKELDIHTSTLRRWLRECGVEPKKNGHVPNPRPDDPDPLQTALDEELQNSTREERQIASHDARLAEDQSIMEVADSQASPADKYQTYVAATSIKLLRDSVKNLRGPRTVKELSELDQLIRRNLGLNAKNGGGSGKVQIDISILNNTKADKGGGSIKTSPKKIIEAEPLDD
tara:strand:- start:4079 stop:4672 length:594 start_codon:yes stop_codon:yes gene_type:complete